MENASKALLIAAAVLVVILLIASGMRVLNSSKSTADQAQSTGTAINEKTTTAGNSLYKQNVATIIGAGEPTSATIKGSQCTPLIDICRSQYKELTVSGVGHADENKYYTVGITYNSGGIITSLSFTATE